MARAIELVLGPELSQRIGLVARRRVETGFSLEAMVGAYEEVYSSICSPGGRVPS